MALIYITGIAGSGKSTLLKELQRRGYEVHDADENLSFWANKSSSARVDVGHHTLTTDPKFFDEHDWYIDAQGIENLEKESKGKTVFIGGSVANEKAVWDLFEKVFCLYIDDESLAKRIKNRTEKDFGKTDHELIHILKLNRDVQAKYKSLSAVVIDGTQPAEKIADEIIDQVE